MTDKKDYPRRRELTGVYFSIWRDGEFVSIDVSDMIEDEVRKVYANSEKKDLVNCIVTMVNAMRKVGDKYKIPFTLTRDELKTEIRATEEAKERRKK